MIYDGSWNPDFPPVMHFVDLENSSQKPWKFIEAHPDYKAAKFNEDRVAAMRLIHDFLKTPENGLQLSKLRLLYPNAIVVSVHAVEASGKNQIPQMLADYIGKRTGLEVDDGIIQVNRVHRTGTDEWHRFAFRPSFDGEVKKDRNYIIVDDVFSLGGSFNELRRFIESRGGNVVQAVAIATGRSGQEIAPSAKTLKSLIDKYGKDALSSFLKEVNLYDGNFKALTEPEARALRRASSLDKARDRILAARQERRTYLGSEIPRQDGDQTSRQSSRIASLNENTNLKEIEFARKAGYVQGVCDCVAAIGDEHKLGKKLLSEMNVTKDIAKKFANSETFKTLEQGIFAPEPEQTLDQNKDFKR